jgi:hypothetical protein
MRAQSRDFLEEFQHEDAVPDGIASKADFAYFYKIFCLTVSSRG